MKCSGKPDTIVHEIFRVVSHFPRCISCYIAESRYPLGQCMPPLSWKTLTDGPGRNKAVATELYYTYTYQMPWQEQGCRHSAPHPGSQCQLVSVLAAEISACEPKQSKRFLLEEEKIGRWPCMRFTIPKPVVKLFTFLKHSFESFIASKKMQCFTWSLGFSWESTSWTTSRVAWNRK